MIAEQRGCVPGYSSLLARTHLNEAWRDIRNMTGWSFQHGHGGFGTPSVINGGTVTVAFGSNTVVGDATAAALWATGSVPGSLLTQRQFRVGAGTIYNIIAYDGASTLTLDRFYFDTAAGTNLGYAIYQCYYAAPVSDFMSWEAVVDINNSIDLVASGSKKFADFANQFDPQRQIFSNPGSLLAFGQDSRLNSSTLGFQLYELYPQPQAQYAYQTWFMRLGADLVLPTDTLPFPITEHAVKTAGRVKAYEWYLLNRDKNDPRGPQSDSAIQFAMGAAAKEAAGQLKDLRNLDRDRVDLWHAQMTRVQGFGYSTTFNPATGLVTSSNTL